MWPVARREFHLVRNLGMALFRIGLAIVATALIAFGGVGLMAQTGICPGSSSGRCFPNTTNGIFTYSDQIDMDGLTNAQLQFFATNYVGGQKQTAAQAATLRALNSNFLVLHYRLSEFLGYGTCSSATPPVPTTNSPLPIVDTPTGDWGLEWPWSDNTTTPQTITTPWPGGAPSELSWYAGANAPVGSYTYSGSPWVYACGSQHFLMNIGDLSPSGWPAFYSGLVLQEMQDNTDDGVFADSFSIPTLFGGFTPSLPLQGTDPAFEQTWATNMHAFTDYMRTQFAGNYLWIPNVGDWVYASDPTDYTNVDGAMIEFFAEYGAGSGTPSFLAPADWATQMSRDISLANLNKIVIMQDYPSAAPSASYERLFDAASYLLVKGNYSYLNMNATGPVQWWPEYNIPIGTPIEALPSTTGTSTNAVAGFQMTSGSGATYYQRAYSNGIVLVNPAASDTGLINLGQTYYMAVNDPDPNQGVVPADGVPTGQINYAAVSYVDLAPCPTINQAGSGNCAAILLSNAPTGPGLPTLTPTVTVTTSSSIITPAQSLTVTIAVNGGTGNPTPTGSVILSGGGYNSGATALTSGSAAIVIPAGSLALGSDTLMATFTPDSTSSSIYFGAAGVSSPVTMENVIQGPDNEFDWTWMGGSSTIGTTSGLNGVYPAQPGPPAASGIFPGGREAPALWADNSGNIWLFGGAGFDSVGTNGGLNDLWEFTPSTGLWTWEGGSNTAGGTEVNSGLGNFAAGNIPESFFMGSNWTDLSGNLWLFGGWGALGTDMWEYKPSLGQWAWVGGSFTGQNGVYGTQGVPNAANIPGYRGNQVGVTDNNGNFWLFGGYGVDSVGNWGDLNDLWEFTPSTGMWTWVSGSNQNGGYQSPGNYGTMGVSAVGTPNVPPGRDSMSAWIDADGNFWVFGGENANINADYNDLWEFTPSTGLWTWVSGSNTTGSTGVYGALGVPSTVNVPESRDNTVSWTDSTGNLWLFGGNIGGNAFLNDLWEFTPSTSMWTWMGGSTMLGVAGGTTGLPGVYGTLGIPTVGSTPGSRQSGSSVTDFYGNLWLFGGEGLDSADNSGSLNDMWEYKPPTVKTTPAIAVTPSALSITSAQDLAVTVAVSGTIGTPTGTVVLTGGGYTSTAATLVNGSATINIIAGGLAVGSDTLTASYAPDRTDSPIYTSASGTAAVTVSAVVVPPAPAFAISGSAVTVAAGATTGNTSTITLTPSGGFTGNVQLIAAITASPNGAVELPTLSFSTNPVSASGTTTLTITTTAAVAATKTTSGLVNPKGPGRWYAAGGATLACILLFGIPAKRRSWRTTLGMLLLLVALAGSGVLACGGTTTSITETQATPGTTAGAYTITVIGTSGTTTEAGTVSLTVQ